MENNLIDFDKKHILHPYAPSSPSTDMELVKSANGVYLELEDG